MPESFFIVAITIKAKSNTEINPVIILTQKDPTVAGA